ncbi:uncharacterized protein LOC143445478 [Clavelina lepadiformis]|uniref:X-box-binding protein 1 n=1 Tax=Clavelina lepadiformis TaxID=159417 RepID=A0ABP0GTF9_CLALP
MSPTSSDHETDDVIYASESKELRKKLRNRESAQRARDRQKARMQWLEQEVSLLQIRNEILAQENIVLKSLLLTYGAKHNENISKESENEKITSTPQNTREILLDSAKPYETQRFNANVSSPTDLLGVDPKVKRKRLTPHNTAVKRTMSCDAEDRSISWPSPQRQRNATFPGKSMLQSEVSHPAMPILNPFLNIHLGFAAKSTNKLSNF